MVLKSKYTKLFTLNILNDISDADETNELKGLGNNIILLILENQNLQKTKKKRFAQLKI